MGSSVSVVLSWHEGGAMARPVWGVLAIKGHQLRIAYIDAPILCVSGNVFFCFCVYERVSWTLQLIIFD